MTPSSLYQVGNVLTLHSHQPPPPLDTPYQSRRIRIVNQLILAYPKLEVCLRLPPTETPQPSQKNEIEFKISRAISMKDGHGAQVVLGTACFPNTSVNLVAKIYDPMFYPAPDPRSSKFRTHAIDFTASSERDYTREAAAYVELDPHLGGTTIPKYYGSWSCDVPAGDTTRPVRLILIEHIAGQAMIELKPSDFSENQRQEIMGQIFEASVNLIYHGVRHMDFFTRNVLVSLSNQIRVVVVDFNCSIVHRLAGFPILKRYISSAPRPPLNYKNSNFWDWEQSGWISQSDDWKIKRWGTAEFQLLPKSYRKAMAEREMFIRNSYIEQPPPLSHFSLALNPLPLPSPGTLNIEGTESSKSSDSDASEKSHSPAKSVAYLQAD